MPKFELPPTPSSVAGPDPRAGPPTGKQGHKRHKDLPKRNSTFGLSKPSRRNALKLAKAKGALANVIARVEDDYYANSSKAAKNSKRNTVAEILKAGDASYPLTPFSLKLIAGTLRESGYFERVRIQISKCIPHRSQNGARRTGSLLDITAGSSLQAMHDSSQTWRGPPKESC